MRKRGRLRRASIRWRFRRRIRAAQIAGVMVIAVVAAMATLLAERKPGSEVDALVGYAAREGVEPVALITAAAAAHRIVLLGDQPGTAAPKRIAAEAVERLARGPGLDAVVLEFDSEDQPFIDRYLHHEQENVAYLLTNVRGLGHPEGASRGHLEILRRVWRLNQELGPGRRIRVIAADLPGWPPARATAPRDAALRFAERDEHMAERIHQEILAHDPRARILIFVSNLHVLKAGPARIAPGAGSPVELQWLGARLHALYPASVFSIITDAGPWSRAADDARSALGTAAFQLFRRNLQPAAAFGVRVDDRFDLLRPPVFANVGVRLSLDPLPTTVRLRDAIDGYVYIGSGKRTLAREDRD